MEKPGLTPCRGKDARCLLRKQFFEPSPDATKQAFLGWVLLSWHPLTTGTDVQSAVLGVEPERAIGHFAFHGDQKKIDLMAWSTRLIRDFFGIIGMTP